MTVQEMRNLEVGDRVVDLHRSGIERETVHCKVDSIDDDGVIISSLNSKHNVGFPHRFYFNKDESLLERIEITPHRVGE